MENKKSKIILVIASLFIIVGFVTAFLDFLFSSFGGNGLSGIGLGALCFSIISSVSLICWFFIKRQDDKQKLLFNIAVIFSIIGLLVFIGIYIGVKVVLG